METNACTPDRTPEKHDIWFASRFTVAAPSYDEASAHAAAWLGERLSIAAELGSEPIAIVAIYPAQSLHQAAVLAVKLLALEEKGGDALRRVEQLRVEVDDQMRLLAHVSV